MSSHHPPTRARIAWGVLAFIGTLAVLAGGVGLPAAMLSGHRSIAWQPALALLAGTITVAIAVWRQTGTFVAALRSLRRMYAGLLVVDALFCARAIVAIDTSPARVATAVGIVLAIGVLGLYFRRVAW